MTRDYISAGTTISQEIKPGEGSLWLNINLFAFPTGSKEFRLEIYKYKDDKRSEDIFKGDLKDLVRLLEEAQCQT